MTDLDELDGLTGAKRAVLEFAKPDSGVHAVLLYGARGSGKRRLADYLSRCWLGGNIADHPAVNAFDNGRSADLLVVEPMGPSRIIRDPQITPSKGPNPIEFKGVPVLEFLRTPPLSAAKKIVMILDADRMNSAAANVLLKSLEEPHEYAKFILTTTTVGSLPPTILSRCSAVACELPDERKDDPMWKLAEGAPGRYQEFLQHEAVYRGLWQFAETLPQRGRMEALVAAESLKGIADSLQKATESNARSANAETLELLAIALRHLHPDWHLARHETIETHKRVIGNGNAGLLYDALMTRIL